MITARFAAVWFAPVPASLKITTARLT